MLIDFILFLMYFTYFLFSRRMFSQTGPRPWPRPGRDPRTTGRPICNLRTLWPGRSCRSHARASRAAARPGTTSYGGAVGSSSGLPGCSSNGQLLLLGTTRSLGTLLARCVSTIELLYFVAYTTASHPASKIRSEWNCGEQGVPRLFFAI